MGTTASTRCNVRNISIDQNDFNRTSAGSKKTVPVIGIFLGKSPAKPSAAQVRNDKVSLIKRALTAEAKTQDFEGKIKCLERQLRTMEMRNHDLSTELAWLRQANEASNTQVPNASSDLLQSKGTEAKNAVDNSAKELEYLRETVDQLRTSGALKELRIVELQRENEVYRDKVASLEELCRDKIVDDRLANVSPAPSSVPISEQGRSNSSASNEFRVQSANTRRNSIYKKVSTVDDPVEEESTDKSYLETINLELRNENKEEVSENSGSVEEENGETDVTDILNTSVRSTTAQSLRSQSSKSRDSGYIDSSFGKDSKLKDYLKNTTTVTE